MIPCDNCIEIECEVNGLICPLYNKYRDATSTESKCVYDYINAISKPTGIIFDELESAENKL